MAVFVLETPFKELWRVAYIREAEDGRKRIDLVNSSKDRTTISFARYLMCVKLGKFISEDYEVDHIDADCTNDDLSNLQILTKEEHLEKTTREATTGRTFLQLVCPNCRITFKREVRFTTGNKENNFCSRHCNAAHNGKIGRLKVGVPLTDDKIREIRSLFKEGKSGYRVAKMMGISTSTALKYRI